MMHKQTKGLAMVDIDEELQALMDSPPLIQPKEKIAETVEPTTKPKKLESKSRRKTRRKNVEEDMDDMEYRPVPKMTLLPTCGVCRNKLKTGDKHWYYAAEGERYWWCTNCMKKHCDVYPPEEEKRE